MYCMNCGVKLVVSAHAGSIRELRGRPGISVLVDMFDRAALLGQKGSLLELAELQS